MSAGSSLAEPFDWVTLAPSSEASEEWSHSGIAVDAEGTVYWAEIGGEAIIASNESTGRTVRIEVPLLEIHDITISPLPGPPRLWLADPGFKMRPPLYLPEGRRGRAGVLDVESGGFVELECPEHPRYAEDSWRPTSVAVDDTESVIVVADGYGASLLHFFHTDDHTTTIDNAAGVALNCPHGVAFLPGPDGPEVVVADRGNRRLLLFDTDGQHVRTFTHPSLRSPSGLAVLRGNLLVTDLDGALLEVDLHEEWLEELIGFPSTQKQPGWPNLQTESGTTRPALRNGELNSPHGVAVDVDGAIFLTEWVIGGRELRLSGHHSSHPEHQETKGTA